jgi:MoaA/NifB/PqqE/SkfB family radical SAM enzyme
MHRKAQGNFFLKNFRRSDRIFRMFRHFPGWVRSLLIDSYVDKAKSSAEGRFCPERMTLFITNQCNMKCAHCFIVKEVQPKIEMMTVDDYRKLFTSVRGGVSQILLTGGEVTLRKDLPDIVIAASKEGRIETANIFSNGHRTELLIQQFEAILQGCDIRLNYQTSLDGVPEFHDINRRVPKAYENAMKTIAKIQELAAKHPSRFGRIMITTAISSKNMKDLKEICELILKTGASPAFCFVRTSEDVFNLKGSDLKSSFTPEKTKTDGTVKFADGDFLSVEQMSDVLNVLNERVWDGDKGSLNLNYNRVTLEAIRDAKASNTSPLTDECRMGFDDVVILADGLVSRCENLSTPTNLKNFDFHLPNLMKSAAWQDYMKKTAGCWCLHDCGIGVSVMKEKGLIKRLAQ